MRALTVEPGKKETLALTDVADPKSEHADALLVKTLAIGLCGTDHEIIEADISSALQQPDAYPEDGLRAEANSTFTERE